MGGRLRVFTPQSAGFDTITVRSSKKKVLLSYENPPPRPNDANHILTMELLFPIHLRFIPTLGSARCGGTPETLAT